MAVTIYDIAKKAGCSPSTVSLVINDSKKISDATKEHVRRIAAELGYYPNYTARSLKNSQTYTIGVIAPNLKNPLFCMMISGITDTAIKHGYNIVLGLSEQSIENERNNIRMLSERRVDGLVVFPSFLEEIFPDFISGVDEKKIPLILCGTSSKCSKNINYVKSDNQLGAFLATEHLINQGYKNIAFICAVTDKQQAASRIEGYKKAHEKYKITYKDELISFCSQEKEDIFNTTVNLISTKEVDAIFCLYDYMALTVIQAVNSVGKRIPEDIGIIGYDNIDIGVLLPTKLSSVDTHAYEVGQLATEKLINKIQNPDLKIDNVILKPEIKIRDSSKKAL